MECTRECAHTWRPDTDVMCFPRMIKNKNLIFWDRVSHSTWSSLVRQDWLSRFLLSLPTHTPSPYLKFEIINVDHAQLLHWCWEYYSCSQTSVTNTLIFQPSWLIQYSLLRSSKIETMALYIVHIILLLVGTCIDGIHITIKFWGGRNLSLIQLCIIWA